MKYFSVFFKKEIKEYNKTYKSLILISLFCFFGFLSPMTAKYLPDLMNTLVSDTIQIILVEPTWIDSWQQFFKNISQMGLIVIIALFIGIMNREYQNGTLINLVSKGVSRTSIVLSKFVASLLLFSISFFLCSVIAVLYTQIYFDVGLTKNLIIALIILYLSFCFLLSLLLFVSTVSNKETNGLLILCILITPLLLLTIIPKAVYYNPLTLLFNSMDIINGNLLLNDIIPAIIITAILIIVLLIATITLFKKKEI